MKCLVEKKCSKKEQKVLEENFYALEQLDAFGKLPSTGIFEIPLIFDGNYQECQRISGTKYETNYCYLVLVPGKNSSCSSSGSSGLSPSATYFRSATCMSESCNSEDLPILFNRLKLLPFTACAAFCSKFPVEKNSGFWGFSIFLAVMISILLIASVVDFVLEKKKIKSSGCLLKILMCFSVWRNSEVILSVKEQKVGFIKSMDSIRFLSMLWVVTGHTFTFLIPPDTLIPGIQTCQSYWWKNLLYINNMGGSETACYAPSWYLALDTQLYLIAPIILIGLWFSSLIGSSLAGIGSVASVITVYVLYSIYDLPADFFGNGNTNLLYDMIYHKPWIRCPPYFMGLLVGYFLAEFGSQKVKIPWILAIFGWILAFGLGIACMFCTYDYDKGAKWSIFARATYYNFSRIAWSIFVSWVIIANHMGWGGPINNFMSHPIWQPLGRLSYCAYIVHFFTLFWFLNISDHSMHFYSTFQVFIYYAVPACLLSYIFAFF
ncbi:hypothetical protein B9Z55_021264 [Caenorhabditis nigoni]|nr:hypothetical protein B9Z55_021264 [Caenorhabditis nigoni]